MMFVLQILFKSLVWRVGIEFMSSSANERRERAGLFTLVGLHLLMAAVWKSMWLLSMVFPPALAIGGALWAAIWIWSLASYFGLGWRGALWMIPTQAVGVYALNWLVKLLPGL